MTKLNRDDTLDVFRQHVLHALDKAADQVFMPDCHNAGSLDRDLPAIFSAIDTQVSRLAARYGFQHSVDEKTGDDFYIK